MRGQITDDGSELIIKALGERSKLHYGTLIEIVQLKKYRQQ